MGRKLKKPSRNSEASEAVNGTHCGINLKKCSTALRGSAGYGLAL